MWRFETTENGKDTAHCFQELPSNQRKAYSVHAPWCGASMPMGRNVEAPKDHKLGSTADTCTGGTLTHAVMLLDMLKMHGDVFSVPDYYLERVRSVIPGLVMGGLNTKE